MLGETVHELFDSVTSEIQGGNVIYRPQPFGAFITSRRRTGENYQFYITRGPTALYHLIRAGRQIDDIEAELSRRKGISTSEARELLKNYLTVLAFRPQEAGRDRLVIGLPEGARVPEAVSLELWVKCNLRCTYCYSDSAPEKSADAGLTPQDWVRVVEQLPGAGVTLVSLVGGEPTMYPGFMEVLQAARRADLYVKISTNGVLLGNNRRLLEQVSGLADEVHITIDGADSHAHNATRSAGFEATVRAARGLAELWRTQGGSRVSVGTVYDRRNAAHANEIIDLVATIRPSFYTWNFLTPVGRGTADQDNLLNRAESIELTRTIHERCLREIEKGTGMNIMAYAADVTKFKMSHPTTRCGAVNYHAYVTYTGDVLSCTYVRKPELALGNVREASIEQIFHSPMAEFFRQEHDPEGGCVGCSKYEGALCNTGCKALKIAAGLSMFETSPRCMKSFYDGTGEEFIGRFGSGEDFRPLPMIR